MPITLSSVYFPPASVFGNRRHSIQDMHFSQISMQCFSSSQRTAWNAYCVVLPVKQRHFSFLSFLSVSVSQQVMGYRGNSFALSTRTDLGLWTDVYQWKHSHHGIPLHHFQFSAGNVYIYFPLCPPEEGKGGKQLLLLWLLLLLELFCCLATTPECYWKCLAFVQLYWKCLLCHG